jgi:thiamine-phosphate pyrophosphorylase
MTQAALPRDFLGLYLVLGGADCGARDLGDLVRAALAGGVTCVQLREKQLDTRAFVARALRLKEVLAEAPRRVPLIINDRLDVALAAGADGVHVGASDMPVEIVRRLWPEAIIGYSVEAEGADLPAGVDYLAASPVFATATKPDAAPALGLAGLRALRARTAAPLVAIGGIGIANATAVFEAGADGIAVVSAICASADPAAAAAALARARDAAARRDVTFSG